MRRGLVFIDRYGDKWDFDYSNAQVTRRRDRLVTTYGELYEERSFWHKGKKYLIGRYEEPDNGQESEQYWLDLIEDDQAG